MPFGLAFLAFVVYVATLFPGVAGGDSGEFIVAGSTLGVPHPPGYPLYMLLVKLATLFPFGTVAWRANLLSGLLAAAAVCLLAAAIARWTSNRWAGVLAGGLFAFSFAAWEDATRAEVFALNNLFAAGLLYLAVLYAESKKRRTRRFAFFLCGLGLANQQTFLFFAAPFLAWMLWEDRKELPILAACLAAGLLPYLYLPIASLRPTPAQWGDETNIPGFLTHVLRREYGTFRLTDQFGVGSFFLDGLWLYLGNVFRLLLGVGMAAAMVGLGRQLKSPRFRKLAMASIAAFVFYVLVFNFLANLPLNQAIYVATRSRFWEQSDLLLCAWAGLGLAAWAPWLGRALPAATIGAVLVPLVFGWKSHDHHADWVAEDYARSVLNAAPANSLLLVNGDLLSNGARYLQVEEGVRPDVSVLPKYMFTRAWARQRMPILFPKVRSPTGTGGLTLAQLVAANASTVPVWICGEASPTLPGYQVLPYGMCDGVQEAARPIDPVAWAQANEHAQLHFRNPPESAEYNGDWDIALRDYWVSLRRRADFFAHLADARSHDPTLLEQAAIIYETIAAHEPRPPAVVYLHMGRAYYYLTPAHPGFRDRWRQAWARFLALAPATDPSRKAVQRALMGDGILVEPLDGTL